MCQGFPNGIFFPGNDISPCQDAWSKMPHLYLLPRFTCFVTYVAPGIGLALSNLA